MPETGREVSDERSTPTGWLVTSLVELERRGSPITNLSHRRGQSSCGSSRVSGDASREPASTLQSAIARQTGGFAGRLPRPVSA